MNPFERAVPDCMLPTAVIKGKDGVLAFCRSVGEAVLWPYDDRARLEGERGERSWVLDA
jgi:hypothetical protein